MGRQIELRHLRYFRAVAENLHFGKAAIQLGMAQPPLSQQIKALENIVGHRLFERTTRGVLLTTVGEYFLERAEKTLVRIDQDLDMAGRIGRGQEGVLSVGFAGSIMLTRLPFVIEHYRRLFPKVEVQLQELVTADQIAALKDGMLDVAFLRDGEADGSIQLKDTLEREVRRNPAEWTYPRFPEISASHRSTYGTIRVLRTTNGTSSIRQDDGLLRRRRVPTPNRTRDPSMADSRPTDCCRTWGFHRPSLCCKSRLPGRCIQAIEVQATHFRGHRYTS